MFLMRKEIFVILSVNFEANFTRPLYSQKNSMFHATISRYYPLERGLTQPSIDLSNISLITERKTAISFGDSQPYCLYCLFCGTLCTESIMIEVVNFLATSLDKQAFEKLLHIPIFYIYILYNKAESVKYTIILPLRARFPMPYTVIRGIFVFNFYFR